MRGPHVQPLRPHAEEPRVERVPRAVRVHHARHGTGRDRPPATGGVTRQHAPSPALDHHEADAVASIGLLPRSIIRSTSHEHLQRLLRGVLAGDLARLHLGGHEQVHRGRAAHGGHHRRRRPFAGCVEIWIHRDFDPS